VSENMLRQLMKVRPFERIVVDIPARYSGRIDDGQFVVQFGDVAVPIPAVEIGQDSSGEFAMLEVSEQVLRHGFKLAVEPDFDEFAPDGYQLGCHIKLERRETVNLSQSGIDPSQFAGVLMPPGPRDVLRSVTFNHGGGVNGWSWYPARQIEPPTAEDIFHVDVLRLLASGYGAYGHPSKREAVVGLVIDHPVTRYEWYWVPHDGKWVATIDPPLSTLLDEDAIVAPAERVVTNIPAWSRDASVLALGIAAVMQLAPTTDKS